MKKQVFESVKGWLYKQAESEIEEVLVEMMLMSMEEPLMQSLPDDRMFAQVPAHMQGQLKDQIVVAVKAQVLVCLRALIHANRENSRINQLIVSKHFSSEQQDEGLAHVEKYSEAYALEVEEFYQKIQASDFQEVVLFN